MSGCLARKRWFCHSQTHISCVQGRSDGPPDRGQLPDVAEQVAKTDTKRRWNRRFGAQSGSTENLRGCLVGIREVRPAFGSSAGPRFCPGQTHFSCVLGRYDLTKDPRPYLGFCLGQTHFSCAHGRCDLTTGPRPYLGLALAKVKFRVFE